jgi:hypothetical protein
VAACNSLQLSEGPPSRWPLNKLMAPNGIKCIQMLSLVSQGCCCPMCVEGTSLRGSANLFPAVALQTAFVFRATAINRLCCGSDVTQVGKQSSSPAGIIHSLDWERWLHPPGET